MPSSLSPYLRGLKFTHLAKVGYLVPQLVFQDNKKLQGQLSAVPTDTTLKVEISVYNEGLEKENLRTEQQNKYYHMLLDIICDHTGDVHLELHERFKFMFLGRPYVYQDKEYIVVKSTTELNSKNFGEYLEKIFAWASENLEITLPEPTKFS